MQSVVDFILELDRLKGVTRKTRPLGLDRYENSAEHSWQIALLALSLLPHGGAAGGRRARRRRCCWCTTSARSTPATRWSTPTAGWATRKRAERAAVERIFGLLPAAAARRTCWRCGWSSTTSRHARGRFAHAADRAMPALLNLAAARAELARERHHPRAVVAAHRPAHRRRLPGAVGLPAAAARRRAGTRLVRHGRLRARRYRLRTK
jgi:putative hydrolase of HD superfamily